MLAPLTKSNVRLLSHELEKIAETPYFSSGLNEYLEHLRAVTAAILSNCHEIPSNVTEYMTAQIWTATKFLSGSTSKKIPYEIVHCLKKALASWTHKNALITTALTQEKNYSFYFEGVPQDFYHLAKEYAGVSFSGELVQIALPQIYQHRPLLNVALYHELGHFLDDHHSIVNLTLLLIPSNKLPLPQLNINLLNQQTVDFVARNHRKEYFADVFSASYAGMAYRDFLAEFANNNPVCGTHPATEDRLALIDSFLAGRENDIIDSFQKALTMLGLRKLEIAFSVPDVSAAFGNVRPYAIQNDGELHGIFEAGSSYLKEVLAHPAGPWLEAGEDTTERLINDLVEKSIRNSMILDRWRGNETLA
jgi:hypothetical protein